MPERKKIQFFGKIDSEKIQKKLPNDQFAGPQEIRPLEEQAEQN